jgi:plasmid stability protein
MTELNLKKFPEDLHRALKVLAAQRGMTLRELVIEILTGSVKPAKRKKGTGQEND